MPSRLGNWSLALAGYLLASVSPTALLAQHAPDGGNNPAVLSPSLLQLADSSEGESGEGEEGGEGESGESSAGENGQDEGGEGESDEGENGQDESGEGESGEGEGEGESGEQSGMSGPFAGAEPEAQLLGQLLMTRGHLLIGHALAAQNMFEAAIPHLHHPREENYPLIENAIAEHKLEPFEDELYELSETGESSEMSDVQPIYESAMAKIDADAAAVLAADEDRTHLALVAALGLLKQAAEEYKESVKDGAVVEAIEYQDSMAFVAEARRLVEGEADALIARDGAKYATLLQEFDALQQAFPSPVPPPTATLSTDAVYGGVSRIEIAMLSLKG